MVGIAIAASYEAKKFGVKTGTRIVEAKQLCAGLHCVLARHDAYVRYHHRILEEVILHHTPINKVCSIDELSSCLPLGKRNRDEATKVATRIRDRRSPDLIGVDGSEMYMFVISTAKNSSASGDPSG